VFRLWFAARAQWLTGVKNLLCGQGTVADWYWTLLSDRTQWLEWIEVHCKKSVLKIQENFHEGANLKFYIPEFFNFKLLIPAAYFFLQCAVNTQWLSYVVKAQGLTGVRLWYDV
jgi:hypothetical protein